MHLSTYIKFSFQIKITMKLLILAIFGLMIVESYAVSVYDAMVEEEWEGWKSLHRKFILNYP